MAAEVIRSASEAPELVSPVEGQSAEVADTEEAMRDALLTVLAQISPVQAEPQVPQEPTDIEQGILRLVELSRAA